MWRVDSLEKTDAGGDWGWEKKGTTEDEMAGWRHQLDGRESGWTPGVGDGQEGLACCDSWGCKESDTTERLNWTELNWTSKYLTLLSAELPMKCCLLNQQSRAPQKITQILDFNQVIQNVVIIERSYFNSWYTISVISKYWSFWISYERENLRVYWIPKLLKNFWHTW